MNNLGCPRSGVWHIKRNGHTHDGKQNYRCQACGRQFVADSQHITVYRQQASFDTDGWGADQGVIPAARHQVCDTGANCTGIIERFNCSIRQRVSRLVQKALSFSKGLRKHKGAIKHFICQYNLEVMGLA